MRLQNEQELEKKQKISYFLPEKAFGDNKHFGSQNNFYCTFFEHR